MQKRQCDISILLYPSVRALAYLAAFKRVGLVPAELIVLSGAIPKLDQLRAEWGRHQYGAKYFDLDDDIDGYALANNVKTIHVATNDVNTPLVCEALKQCRSRYVVFAAGGIMGKETLSLGKEFIHVHPGVLPNYRGSTCFYYSLLTDFTLAATAFLMAEGIDTGRVVTSRSFNVNCRIHSDQRFFMDFVLDPFIRSITLMRVLESYMNSGVIVTHAQAEFDHPAYYVMHPLLRHVVVDKINKKYDPSIPYGVRES